MDGDEEHGEPEAEHDRLRGNHAEHGLPLDLHGVRVRARARVKARAKARLRATARVRGAAPNPNPSPGPNLHVVDGIVGRGH